ncbi:MAG TPA: hypothetical protein VKW04_00415 [Planctomycetota bacterium]|nr:hypothetical protein [Planctomycetota bacterium]
MDPISAKPSPPERFNLHQVLDPQHQRVVAGTFEYPPGWTAQSSVVWNFQHLSFPVIMFGHTIAPTGIELVNFLPVDSFVWVEPNYGMLQPGTPSLGKLCLPPMPAAKAMQQLVIPKYRGKCQGLKVVSVVPLPGIAKFLGANSGGLPIEEVCATIEYDERGQRIVEEIYGVKITRNVPYYGPQGMSMEIQWGFPKLFTFRSTKSGLPLWKGRFWRIVQSARLNPAWETLCAQISQQLAAQFNQFLQMGYSQIQAAGQLSAAISANNDAMLRAFEQQRMAAAHSRPAASGRSATDGFDEYIRGVETMDDPYRGTSQQDATYQYHWTDGSGTYQHSNDPFFNPNIGGTVTWTMMDRSKGA